MSLSDRQVKALMRPLHPSRVSTREGKFSYVESYDVIARLNMIFGFDGWSKSIRHLDLIFETENDKGWTVAYRCVMIFEIDGKSSEDVATGVANNQRSRADAHDLAAKSAVSDALKRCAKDLGDQFGLCLYNQGSLKPTATASAVYDVEEDKVVSDGDGGYVQQDSAGTITATDRIRAQSDPEDIITKPQMAKIRALCKEINRDAKVVASEALGEQVFALQLITKKDASVVIDYINELNQPSPNEIHYEDEEAKIFDDSTF